MTKYFVFLEVFIALLTITRCHSYLVDDNPYRHFEILDKNGKYELEWSVDWTNKRVIFNVTVETKGYIGFGLSRKGKMSGADIVIGGVRSNGQPYFSDRHAIGNQYPVEDISQDWKLHEAWESKTHTYLAFSREFDTCDEDHDLPIHDDVIGLIWSFGETDNESEYHHENRGVLYRYLLDPDLTPRGLKETEAHGIGDGGSFGNFKVWSITQLDIVPNQTTSYVCSVHKTPGNRKQHIVGVRQILPTEVEQRHVHHFLLHRCIPPGGRRELAYEMFDHLQGLNEECYLYNQPTGQIPTQYCTEVVHIFAVGQLPIFFPEHVGIPMYPGEYYTLQVHYDNPDAITGVRINQALEIFYTDELREHDAGLLTMGVLNPGSVSIMVPPNSLGHQIYGHCGSECTKRMLPPDGIKIFAGNLHTHLTGIGMRRLHIRNGKELPWIAYDDNYNFNFQQVRLMREERSILPGDAIIDRCLYSNVNFEGNATIGGFSTRNEMCTGYLYYYNKINNIADCRSEQRSTVYRDFVQIYNETWSNADREHIVTSPVQNAGLLVSEVATARIDWTLANRKQLQKLHRYLPQVTMCPSPILGDDEHLDQNTMIFQSTYPKNIVPYQRPSVCSSIRVRN